MLGGRGVACDDAIAVVGTELADVRDGVVRRSDDSQSEDEIEKLGPPIFLGRVPERLVIERGELGESSLVGAQFDFFLRQAWRELAQESRRNFAMDEHGLERVADAGPLGFAVKDDFERHFEVRLAVDVCDADAIGMLDHRHAGGADDGLDQRFPAARDDEVDEFVHLRHVPDGGAVGL